MESSLYEEILHDIEAIGAANTNDKIFDGLFNKYSNIPEETLRSIVALWSQRKVTKISSTIKNLDIYSLYKSLRKQGTVLACQKLARNLGYPPSLIAKIVVTSFLSATKAKCRLKAQEIKQLRKLQCSYCQKKGFQAEVTDCSETPLDNEIMSMKKHNDPRVELALNLFDQDDEIGKFFLEKFNPQNQSNFIIFSRDFLSENESSLRNSMADDKLMNKSYSSDSSFSALMNNFKDFKMDDTSCQMQNEISISSNIDSCDVSYSSTSDVNNGSLANSYVCTCVSDLQSDSSNSNSDESDNEGEYSVKDLMENTSLIDDPVLAQDAFVCSLSDDQYGPTSDIIGHSAGITYELLLEEYVKDAGLSHKTENKLRGVGVDKTPDIILQVPVAVDNFIINWIESKALFADYKLHQELKKNQYKNYLNRFGPGLVIYWRGYVADLPDLYLVENKQLLVRDNFPPKDSLTFMNSTKFRLWMKSKNKTNS